MDRQIYLWNRYQRNRDFVNEFKATKGCMDCGIINPVVLDFHHVGDDKTKNISHMITKGYSLERIQLEINKCVVLCANCHRIRHHQGGAGKEGTRFGSVR